MKKIIFSFSLFLISGIAFSQGTKTNGTIYIDHPNIAVVLKSIQAYEKRDMVANAACFADTAKFWASGMSKSMPVKDAIKMWDGDFDFYTDIKLIPVGYPDYLAYDKDNEKTVQSWWTWSGKSKKTGKVLNISCVQFDDFNPDGKIRFESLYGDFSKMEHK